MSGKASTNDVAVLIVSCDKFEDLWLPFFICFFKYWPGCPYPIYLGSNFATYQDARVRPILVGEDIDYSSNLLAMLEAIQQQWIILWIEDRVISSPVRTERISKLVRQAQEWGAAYLKLVANHPFAFPADKSSEVGEIPRGSRYRICMTIALWKKPVLVELLRCGETAWELERRGSERSNRLEEKFLALSIAQRFDPPLPDVHLIIKGRLSRDAPRFIAREHLQGCIGKRSLQTMGSYWYGKVYVVALNIQSQFKLLLEKIGRIYRPEAFRI